MSNNNQFVDAILGAQVADQIGIPLGQQKQVGGMLAERARVNLGIQTRDILGKVISEAEGTGKYQDPYAVGFGGAKLDTSAPHPGFQGGKYRGKQSSASGKYQFNLATWKDANGGKNAPMTPENQERAFDWLLRNRHKVSDTELASGDFGSILPRLHSWAALPASKADQPKRSYDDIAGYIQKHGGNADMLKSLDSVITGVKSATPRLTPQQIEHAVTPRKDEVAQRQQLTADQGTARMEQEAATMTANRNNDIDAMIADALHGKNNLVDEPSGLPTMWDDQLMKIIKAV
jgi:muramidase (phage lysozyme)